MKWYLIIKVALVLAGSDGPFDTQGECQTYLNAKKAAAIAEYNQGVRHYFMGVEINTKNVSAVCQQK